MANTVNPTLLKIWIVRFCARVDAVVLMVKTVDEAPVPKVSVDGLNEQLERPGRPEQLNVTGPVKRAATKLSGMAADCPARTVAVVLGVLIWKSGVAKTVCTTVVELEVT